MKKLKEKFGKYFQFKNTINGTNYFLRGFLMSFLLMIPLAIFMGVGIGFLSFNLVAGIIIILIALLLTIPFMCFLLATTYKRINALFPNYSKLLTFLTFVYNFNIEFFNPNDQMDFDPELLQTQVDYINPFSNPMYTILILFSLSWQLYLIFGNSSIDKNSHVG